MSVTRHIVDKSNRKTVQHKYTRKQKNGKPTKRSPSQTNERPTRPNNPTIPKHPTNARIPNNNPNPQKLRHIFRTKHHISTTKHTRKEKLCQQRMEHERRTTKKSLQPNKQRKKRAKLHWAILTLNLQKNNNANKRRNDNNRQQSISNELYSKEKHLHTNKPFSSTHPLSTQNTNFQSNHLSINH